ncbi:2'-5' RNA ligase family protein [candidate division WWE3 bacterium]|uniref:2'-5' RNA ligase family protein n=1 Tax=candidate division WWE3 bacterium TaxID=2053526 RepID=A0A7X9HHR1_UNCKA|nr:2'-5' RNA ligase family protein [candidate division WWE3 bacterium]
MIQNAGTTFYGKLTHTVFSVDSIIDNAIIISAKRFMNEKFGNKYSHIPPHLSYALVPFPINNLEKAKIEIISYIKKLRPYTVEFSELKYGERNNIFFIEVLSNEIPRLHQEITNLLNVYRDDSIRTKDLERVDSGYFTEQELMYLKKYGYSRVFDCYKPHISIGNFTVPDVDVNELTETLKQLLSGLYNKRTIVNNIHVSFHTDADNQSDMKVIWEDTILLK